MSTGIVVGATGGIGAACARALAGTAERIVLTGRRQDALEELGREMDAVVVAADITSAEGREAVAAAAGTGMSWLVLASRIPLRRPLAELDDDEIEAAFRTNLVGPTLLLRRLLAHPWDEPRAGAAEEIARVVRYVTVEAPSYLTGARIVVDGGAEAVA
jgi:NAD(P)-dependent dehydrogenase (short-subunit alcohol dehydrogenase family)